MVRGASSHFSLKGTDFDSYYSLALGVLQNFDFLVGDALRLEDRALLRAIPRSGAGPGAELELRRRPKGVDVHVLVVPSEELPTEPGQFLMRQGAFVALDSDPASAAMMTDLLPALRRDDEQKRVDPRFARTPTNIPEWIFFNLTGGSVTWFLATVLATTGAAYLLFWAPDGPYRENSFLIGALLLVLAPVWSGMWARSAGRGFVAAFVTVGIPVTIYVVAALGWGLTDLRRVPGVYTIDAFLTSLAGSSGIFVPFLLGILAAGVGAGAGIIGGRIFPTRMKHPKSSEPI